MAVKFEDHGIFGVNYSITKNQYLKCPLCSEKRKKKHLKTLSINVEKGLWNCHHCDFSGSINLYKPLNQRIKKVKIYKKPPQRNHQISDKTINFLLDRGIKDIIIEKSGITSENDKYTVFNYFSEGNLINRKYRGFDKSFRLESDARLLFYSPLKTSYMEIKEIVITEGELDCLTAFQCGYASLSVPNGAPSENTDLENADMSYLDSLSEFCTNSDDVILILAMDNDKVGIRFRNEISRRLGIERCKTVEYPKGCKDLNDVLINHGEDKVQECIKNSELFPVSGVHKPESLFPRLINLYENGYEEGVSTGWIGVDRIYRPRLREFTVVTGIPNHGKSAWLNHLTINIAKTSGWKFAIYSPENFPFERHIAELMTIYIGKPFDKGYNERMNQDEVEIGAKWVDKNYTFVMPTNDIHNIDDILKLVKVAIKREGVRGVIIDPWNEIEHSRGSMSETDYVSQTLSKIRRFGRVNMIHTWIVAHPFKMRKDNSGNYPVPTPYDISGSAHWRNKPDMCICVHRDFEEKTTTIYNQKTRFKECGMIGEAKLNFNPISSRYYERN